jgi:hypothetical protein
MTDLGWGVYQILAVALVAGYALVPRQARMEREVAMKRREDLTMQSEWEVLPQSTLFHPSTHFSFWSPLTALLPFDVSTLSPHRLLFYHPTVLDTQKSGTLQPCQVLTDNPASLVAGGGHGEFP